MVFLDVRTPTRQTRRRAVEAIHVAGSTGVGGAITGARIRGERGQAQQMVVELHQEKVHGQVIVNFRGRW